MRSRTKLLLILLSVSLNIAFVVAWGTKTLTRTAVAAKQDRTVCSPDSNCRIWCPLHRALATTDAQWQTLEPLQRNFQTASQALGDTADARRVELMDLLAMPDVSPAVLEAKQAEITAVQQRMQRLVVNHLLEEKNVLNARQQATLFAMMRDRGGCAGHAGMMDGTPGDCAKDRIQNNRK